MRGPRRAFPAGINQRMLLQKRRFMDSGAVRASQAVAVVLYTRGRQEPGMGRIITRRIRGNGGADYSGSLGVFVN